MSASTASPADQALLALHEPPADAAGRDRCVLRVQCGVQDPASWLSANDRSRGWQRRQRITLAWLRLGYKMTTLHIAVRSLKAVHG